VSHHRVFSVLSGVNHVTPSGVRMVCCLLMMCGVVVLGRFPWWRAACVRCSDAFS
jgi:hypothetical protein